MIELGKGSGRAECKICRRIIDEDVRTVRIQFGNIYVRTHHLTCFVKKYGEDLKEILEAFNAYASV